jgi:hypothetical protein
MIPEDGKTYNVQNANGAYVSVQNLSEYNQTSWSATTQHNLILPMHLNTYCVTWFYSLSFAGANLSEKDNNTFFSHFS